MGGVCRLRQYVDFHILVFRFFGLGQTSDFDSDHDLTIVLAHNEVSMGNVAMTGHCTLDFITNGA